MQDGVRSDNQIQSAVKNLLKGAAPERERDLESLWEECKPQFQFLDTDDLVMDAGAYRIIRYSYSALRAFWFAGFIAWEGYQKSHAFHVLDSDNFNRFNDMVKTFENLLTKKCPISKPLPFGVPEPGDFPDAEKFPRERSAADLAAIATAWAFLHEVKHLKHQQGGTSSKPNDSVEKHHEEELSCDKYATKFILSGVTEYARSTGEDPEKIRQKRELGIYFALFTLVLISAKKWEDSDSHPSIQKRINATIVTMGSSGMENSDIISKLIFFAIQREWPDAPGPLSNTIF